MKATFQTAWPYKDDAMNLPVADVDKAAPFYVNVMGFKVLDRKDSPHKIVALGRDEIQIALAENGGDPTQEGCFFCVDDVEAAFAELKANGLDRQEANFEVCNYGAKSYRQFFVVAPDGLCFCIGELLQGKGD